MTALNNGETLTGVITDDNVLALKNAIGATIATGTFTETPNQISYSCDGTGYTNIRVYKNAPVTITGTKTPSTIHNFTIDTTKSAGFTNFDTVGLVAATGEPATTTDNLVKFLNELSITSTVYGKCSNNGPTGPDGSQVTLYYDSSYQQPMITFTSSKTVAWIEWVTNNKMNSDGKLNFNIYSIAQQNGAFQLNILYSEILEIDPFLTMDMISDTTGVTFFSMFNAALALSNLDTPSKPRQAQVNNDRIFLPKLSDCVNTPYLYVGNNTYTPTFNDYRYIYGQFSNNGAVLMLYKDQAHTEGIGTFSLPSPQKGEYISKLLWNTDAHVPLSNLSKNIDPTKKEKVDPNGNIRYWVTFAAPRAQSNGSVIIRLI